MGKVSLGPHFGPGLLAALGRPVGPADPIVLCGPVGPVAPPPPLPALPANMAYGTLSSCEVPISEKLFPPVGSTSTCKYLAPVLQSTPLRSALSPICMLISPNWLVVVVRVSSYTTAPVGD